MPRNFIQTIVSFAQTQVVALRDTKKIEMNKPGFEIMKKIFISLLEIHNKKGSSNQQCKLITIREQKPF
jgi:hypothetical protein